MSRIISTTLEKICLRDKGSIISGPFGSNISSKFFTAFGIPVIRGNNLSLSYDKFIDNGFVFITKEKADELKCYAYMNDLIFTAAGTIGQVGIIPTDSMFDEYVISNKQIRARLNEQIVDKLYAYYWFSSIWIRKKIMKMNKGSTVPLLTLSEVKGLPISYPEEINEQHRIAVCIETLSEKIRNNKLINNNLEQQLRLMYDYWFTQFDFPGADGKPYCSSGGEMEWSNIVKRQIPTEWQVASIVSNPLLTVIKPGVKPFEAKEYLATAEVNGTIINNGANVEYAPRESRANMQPAVNSIWFAKMKNSVKHLYLNKEMQELIDSSILSTGFCGLQCKETAFEYICSFISHPLFETQKDILAHGATQEAVNNNDLESIKIVIPNDTVLSAFHAMTQPLYAKISQNICETRKLTALRDWLLPMLMNGQATIVE